MGKAQSEVPGEPAGVGSGSPGLHGGQAQAFQPCQHNLLAPPPPPPAPCFFLASFQNGKALQGGEVP